MYVVTGSMEFGIHQDFCCPYTGSSFEKVGTSVPQNPASIHFHWSPDALEYGYFPRLRAKRGIEIAVRFVSHMQGPLLTPLSTTSLSLPVCAAETP